MNYLKLEDNTPITFKVLFPRSFIKASHLQQSDFLRLFPHKLLVQDDGRHITALSGGQISKYWNVAAGCAGQARCVKDNIINLASAGDRTFSSLTEISLLKDNVANFLSSLDTNIREKYEKDINGLLENFLTGYVNGKKIYRGFKHLNLDMQAIFTEELKDFPSKLSCLMLLASTWYYWDLTSTDTISPENFSTIEALASAILPHRLMHKKKETQNNKELIKEIREKKKQIHDKLETAKINYDNNDYQSCGDICRFIISSGFVEPKDRGYAYYLLVKCRETNNYTYTGYYDAAKFMRQAISLGCEEARAEWKTLHLNSLLYYPKPSDSFPSHIVINSSRSNKRVLCFLKTLPKEMLEMDEDILKKYISYINTGDTLKDKIALSKALYPEKECRYLLLDDNIDKNFNDFLVILNSIKAWKSKNEESTLIYNADIWKNTQIFLRTKEEKYSALIDTAIKHMDGISFPIYIIDDEKWAAQTLLAQHPFYYPIRTMTIKHLKENNNTINLNILSINDDLANWLVREAFWLSCFIYTKLTINLNIFSPEAEKIESRLRFDCKGMWGKLPDSEYTSKININFSNDFDDFNSDKLIAVLQSNSCFKDSDFNYYIINTGNDISNINLGIKLRELTISHIIKSDSKINKIDLPIITFKCEDPDYAHLTESMVVQMEEHGDSWYNNYSLIPFGRLTDRYSYDNLSGGYFEKMALSTHLQYYGVDPILNTDENKILRADAIESYFSRCYNRDSSMAVALSMPYRLFQTTTYSGPGHVDHIIPTGWNITNPFAYINSSSINEMATSFEKMCNLSSLVLYEHARWTRWIISRGWTYTSPEETIEYMTEGNPKHQLYISKQHSCICSMDELKELSKKMYEHYLCTSDQRFMDDKSGGPKDFTAIDTRNLKQTANIISIKWDRDNSRIERER